MDLINKLIPTRRQTVVKVFLTSSFPFNFDKWAPKYPPAKEPINNKNNIRFIVLTDVSDIPNYYKRLGFSLTNNKYLRKLNWTGGFYRKDIGYKVINKWGLYLEILKAENY